VQLQRFRHLAARASRILILMFFWYVSCYFLMMDWRVLPYDPIRHEYTGESCYYLAPMVRASSQFTIITGSACWANSFFRPLDLSLYRAKAAMGFRVFSQSLWPVLLLALGLNLLLPFFSAILRSAQSLRNRGVQVFLSLVVVGWYCGLIVLYHLIRNGIVNIFLGKSLALTGTVVALAAIYWIARARSYKLVVPLAIATVLGTIWLIVSLPCAWPYM